MTKNMQAELQELNISDEAELAARTERANAMARDANEPKREREPMILMEMEAPSPKPTRAPAVKGRCVHCGNHWSRHHIAQGDGLAYCGTIGTVFSLEPRPKNDDPQASPLVDDLDAAVQRLLQATAALRIATYEHEDALTQYGRILQALKAK